MSVPMEVGMGTVKMPPSLEHRMEARQKRACEALEQGFGFRYGRESKRFLK